MANTIKLKNASGSDPSASDLVLGELAVRTDTGKIFLKKDNGNVTEVSGGGGVENGDKGDITVSNSGDTWTIDANAVTRNKISDGEVISSKLDSSAVTTSKINNGAITNDKVSSSAAIAGTKISPDFGSQYLVTTGTVTTGPVFTVQGTEGVSANLYLIADDGDDNGDGWRINSNQDDNDLTISNNISGSYVDKLTLTNGGALTATSFSGSGASLTSLPAGQLTGTIAAARLDTATTQSAGNNSTKIATTAYTDTAISNLVDSSPSALNTLNELAAALGDDANFSTTVTNSIATKLPLAGGTLTGDLTISTTNPQLFLVDTNNNSDYEVANEDGTFRIRDTTNSANRLTINSSGNATFTGNIAVSGTVDGRDLASDGSKLDGIESGATADQSASEILTLIKTVDGAGSGLDADTLDGVSSGSFLRSDANDTCNGILSIAANKAVDFISGNWTGDTSGGTGKIQSHDSALYICGGDNGIRFREHGTDRWYIDGSGHFTPHSDSTYNIGSNGTRVSNGYFDTLYGDGSNLTNLPSQTDNNFTNADHSKLDGIAASATNNGSGNVTDRVAKSGDTMTGELQINARLDVGDGSSNDHEIRIRKADNNISDHIQFYNATTRMGEIGCEDTTWLRINQETNKNIYTPRMIRADGGFQVDGVTVVSADGYVPWARISSQPTIPTNNNQLTNGAGYILLLQILFHQELGCCSSRLLLRVVGQKIHLTRTKEL